MNENEIYLKLSDKIDKLIDKLDSKFDAFCAARARAR